MNRAVASLPKRAIVTMVARDSLVNSAMMTASSPVPRQKSCLLVNERCGATFPRGARMTAHLNRAVMAIHPNALTAAFPSNAKMAANLHDAVTETRLLIHAMPTVYAYVQTMEKHLNVATLSRPPYYAMMTIGLLGMRTGFPMC
jgi:hypothetical protein